MKRMASRYKLVHHPAAADDYRASVDFFAKIDPDLAELFKEDFKLSLRGIATGRASSHVYAAAYTIRWVKLRRFSHKVFFEPEGDETRFVLGIVSGRRHPVRIRLMLGQRKKPRSGS